MKFTIKFLALIFGLLLASAAHAESPREQLRQMVEQLQKSPNDNALREQIIKLAQELKPAPAIPEEAERRMARGTAAFKGAKSVADYREAAKEFEQATLAAPWLGDAYLNLGVTQDKAENYEAALRSLKLALLALPNDKEIKALMYEVEYRNEKSVSIKAVEDDYLVVPSVRIGQIKIGMTMAELQKILGPPSVSEIFANSLYYKWQAGKLWVEVDDDKVVKINCSLPVCHTAEGVKVGMSVDEVYLLQGQPMCKDSWYINYSELFIGIERGRVDDFIVLARTAPRPRCK